METEMKIECKDCKNEFTFTPWEQEFFNKNNWPAPVRCVACRRKKKFLRIELEDGISIKEQGAHNAICAKCGKHFMSILDAKKGENEYCTECWGEIKGF